MCIHAPSDMLKCVDPSTAYSISKCETTGCLPIRNCTLPYNGILPPKEPTDHSSTQGHGQSLLQRICGQGLRLGPWPPHVVMYLHCVSSPSIKDLLLGEELPLFFPFHSGLPQVLSPLGTFPDYPLPVLVNCSLPISPIYSMHLFALLIRPSRLILLVVNL